MNKKKEQVNVKNIQQHQTTSVQQSVLPQPLAPIQQKRDNAIPIIEAIIEQLRTHANELQEETISAASNGLSSPKNSSSFLSRYLSPEVITKFLSNDVQSCCNKIYNAFKSKEVDDAVVAAINTRQFIIDLTCSVRAFVRHASIPIESRITCAQMSSDICSEFATLLVKLKLNVEKDAQVPDIGANVQHIEDLSHDILELISTVNDGPRLVMYFRASSPQWRDVTEKYIGRHVAYHHHYVPNYQDQSNGSGCIQVPYDVNQEKFCIGSEASSKAREKMQTNYQLVYQMLQNSQFDNNLESFLEQCNSLFDHGSSLLSTTLTVLESPRTSEKIQIGRHELVLSLAFEDFSTIIGHYYEACRLSTSDTQPQRKTILRPSRERIITSLQQISQSALNLWLSLSEQTMKLQLNQQETSMIQECNSTCQNIKSIIDSLLTRLRNGELVCNERRSSIDYNGKIVSITVPTS